MRRRASRLWLIPAVIIGFNCLAFILILILGTRKAEERRAAMSSDTLSEDTLSEDSADTADARLDESFYEEDIPEEDIYAYSSGYVLLLTSSESDL